MSFIWEYLSKLSVKGFLLTRQKKKKVHGTCVWAVSYKQFTCTPVSKRLSLDSAAPLRRGWESLPPVSRLRAGEDSSASGAEWVFTSYVTMSNTFLTETVCSWRRPQDLLFSRTAQSKDGSPNAMGKAQQLYALVPG